jgi:hypothetical protein
MDYDMLSFCVQITKVRMLEWFWIGARVLPERNNDNYPQKRWR